MDAAIATVPGRVKLVPATESVAASVGAAITVAFAVADWPRKLLAALRLTPYVPGAAPDGAPLLIVKVVDCPGAIVTADCGKDVDHPEGSVELNPNVLEGHAVASLLVNDAE